MDIQIGDILKLKKPHPCGSREWEVLRVGADFRLRCLGGQRVGEEDDHIDAPFDDHRADLLVTAEGAAVVAAHGQAGLLGDHAGGGAGAAQEVAGEDLAVFLTPGDELRLFIVVGDKRDVLLLADGLGDVI